MYTYVCTEIILQHSAAGNIDARLQGIDHRTRIMLQRPQATAGLPQQHFQSAQTLQTRLPAPRNAISEPYDILHQQRFAGKKKSVDSYIYVKTRYILMLS